MSSPASLLTISRAKRAGDLARVTVVERKRHHAETRVADGVEIELELRDELFCLRSRHAASEAEEL